MEKITNTQLLARPLVDGVGMVHTFHRLATTSSKLEKERILKEEDSTLLQQILTDTYADRKYYVKAYEVVGTGLCTLESHYEVFHRLLEDLAGRVVTGNAARNAVRDTISQFTSDSQPILARILDRNLRIGVGDRKAEDLGTVGKFPVRLANSYKDVMDRVDIFDGNWMVSRKLDGIRCLAFISAMDGEVQVEFRSRQNKVLTTLDNLIPDYKKAFKGLNGQLVLDGEVCLMDEEGNESFHGLMSEITRKGHTIANPKHILYDLMSLDTFLGKSEGADFFGRINTLKAIISAGKYPHLEALDQQVLTSKEQLEGLQAKVKEKGWEGLMVAKNVPYEGKRTNNLLKIKDFKDGEYVVQGVVCADQTRSTSAGSIQVNTVAALIIEHKGNKVQVGTGMSWEQRDRWKEHPEEIVGKTIGVRYFEESTDKKTGLVSLRFPTLYVVYGDSREV